VASPLQRKKVGVTRAIPFATTFIDLNCRMEMWVRGPFDYLHYYLSQGLLERIALDNGVSMSFRLQEAFFIEDLVVAQMTKSILTPVEHGEPLDRPCARPDCNGARRSHVASALRRAKVRGRTRRD